MRLPAFGLGVVKLTSPVYRKCAMPGRYALRARKSKSSVAASSSLLSSSSYRSQSQSDRSGPEDSDDEYVLEDDDATHSRAFDDYAWVSESESVRSHQVPRGSRRKRRKTLITPSKEQNVAPSEVVTSQKSMFLPVEVAAFRESILGWYVENCRQLPWRSPPSYRVDGPCVLPRKPPESESSPGAPYAVWVSEVMSQQTRLSVCVEYWRRWMNAFPTVEALANAPLERVNEIWAGLGYYRRARFLHEGAKQVMHEYNGELPSSVEELLNVRGIGRYTAGAIASVAFNIPAAAVDGNVERVLSRVRPGILPNTEPSSTPGAKAKVFEVLAEDLVKDIECAGDFNQAIMELGATVCTPRAPRCSSCPVRQICGAYAEAANSGEDPSTYAERYPVRDVSRKTKVRDELVLTCVVCRLRESKNAKPGSMEYLLLQRPQEGLLAGMWETPNVILSSSKKRNCSDAARARAMDQYLEDLLPRVGVVAPIGHRISLGETKHIFSHIRQNLSVDLLVVETALSHGMSSDDTSHKWLTEAKIAASAVATQMKKVLKLAFRHNGSALKGEEGSRVVPRGGRSVT